MATSGSPDRRDSIGSPARRPGSAATATTRTSSTPPSSGNTAYGYFPDGTTQGTACNNVGKCRIDTRTHIFRRRRSWRWARTGRSCGHRHSRNTQPRSEFSGSSGGICGANEANRRGPRTAMCHRWRWGQCPRGVCVQPRCRRTAREPTGSPGAHRCAAEPKPRLHRCPRRRVLIHLTTSPNRCGSRPALTRRRHDRRARRTPAFDPSGRFVLARSTGRSCQRSTSSTREAKPCGRSIQFDQWPALCFGDDPTAAGLVSASVRYRVRECPTAGVHGGQRRRRARPHHGKPPMPRHV